MTFLPLLVLIIVLFFVLLSRIQALEKSVASLLDRASFEKTPTSVRPGSVPASVAIPSLSEPMRIDRQPEPARAVRLMTPTVQSPAEEATRFEPHTVDAAPTVETASGQKSRESLESNIGGKLFTGVGAVAVIIGVGFFFRYAIEVGLITEPVRVLLGVLFGIALIALAERFRKRYARYSQILSGTGIGLLYLSLYFGYASYDLFPQLLSFFLMMIVTAAGVALAFRHDSVYLALFAQIGGFLTPFLVSDGGSVTHPLFLYILLLDIGMVLVAWKKIWTALTFSSLLGTALLYSLWYFSSFDVSQAGVAFGYASLFFIFFSIVSVLRQLRHAEPAHSREAVLTLLNAGFFFAVGLQILDAVNPHYRGAFALLFAIIHASAAFLLRESGNRFGTLSKFFASISVVALAMGIPIQFDRMNITIGWAAEGAVLAYLGYALRSRLLRTYSLLSFLLVFFHIIASDTIGGSASSAWLSDRMISLLFSVVAYGVAIYFFHKGRNDLSEPEFTSLSYLLLSCFFVIFYSGSNQMFDMHSAWAVIAFWSLLAFCAAAVSFTLRNRSGRYFAFFMTMVILFGMIFWDSLFRFPQSSGFFGSRVFAVIFGLLAFSGMFLLYRQSEEDLDEERSSATTVLLLESYFLLVWVGASEIHRLFPSYWVAPYLALLSAGAAWIASRLREQALLVFSYLVLLASGFSVVISHTEAARNGYPVINLRVLTFALVIVSMFVFRRILRKENPAWSWVVLARKALSFVLHFLAFFLVNVEVYDMFTLGNVTATARAEAIHRLQGMRNVALSVAWSVYAITTLAYGIFRKSAPHRIGAMILFGAVILKVFLYDAAGLDTFYRFVSYFSLGVLLLLSGYAYNRFRDRISEFVRSER
ncbi:MAG: DUF2339 domain-containing protein [Candidatus Moraniibacteriota bacterium]